MTSKNVIYNDFAPGDLNIYKRCDGKTFYVPELLHNCPSYSKEHFLCIHDLNLSQSMIRTYGALGYELSSQNFFMIGNHPIQRVKIFGKVLSTHYNDEKEYYIIRIDDSSGRKLIIDVKVNLGIYLQCFLPDKLVYGTIISIQGLLIEYGFQRIKQFLANYISVEGQSGDLLVELEFWQRILNDRKLLQTAWVYEREIEIISLTSDDEEEEDEEEEDLWVTQVTMVNYKSPIELSGEFLTWILNNGKQKFKLIQLYKDRQISKLLDIHIQQDPEHPNKPDLFHRIRHILHIAGELITVSKSQVADCTNLERLCSQIFDELSWVRQHGKVFKATRFVEQRQGDVSSGLSTVHVNFIVKWAVRDEDNWKYDENDDQWEYSA